jgi:predicted nucleic acid-binding protein
MRLYLDSSALIKRSVDEAESEALEAALDEHVRAGDTFVSSALASVEISRALRALLDGDRPDEEISDAIAVALSGVAERSITRDVIGLARGIPPPRLRTLDAIHLASAMLLDVDVIVSYNDRLTEACRQNGLATLSPGGQPLPRVSKRRRT